MPRISNMIKAYLLHQSNFGVSHWSQQEEDIPLESE